MASQPPSAPPLRSFWRDWGPALTILISVLGAAFVIGGVLNEVRTNTADIAEIKTQQRVLDGKLSEISVTVGRTDATLSVLRDRNGQIKQ